MTWLYKGTVSVRGSLTYLANNVTFLHELPERLS